MEKKECSMIRWWLHTMGDSVQERARRWLERTIPMSGFRHGGEVPEVTALSQEPLIERASTSWW
uniref:Uncharacterized protein n=1 Tax=Aegilops tauschii subsp. strangulata TaxID=200361 RepID=A0A453RFK1_AEGTS